MIAKHIDQITEEDLLALRDTSVIEGKTIEYKQELPSNSDADKKEFLADISSFANAAGGDLIFGIVEDRDTGAPESVEGLAIDNIDQEKLRLENMIRDGLEPRVPTIVIKSVNLSNSQVAIVVRVPKSWSNPHRVILGSHDKFYSRNSSGKYPMDVSELRLAFNLSETVAERIRMFRVDRISKIIANETPVPFCDTAKMALHLIPIVSMNPAQSVDINLVSSNTALMPPIYGAGYNNKYNLDGFLIYSLNQEGKSHSYVQLFRNGIIEAVDALLLQPHDTGELYIHSIGYERELIKSLSNYISLLKVLNVEPPVIVFLTLVNVKGYVMGISRNLLLERSQAIDRDTLLLPEIILESYDVSAHTILRPLFDMIWNACGFPKSHNYNDNGEWLPPG